MLSQLIAALFMTSWGANFLLLLGDLFGRGTVHTQHWAIPLTVFATLAVINAVNMFDGAARHPESVLREALALAHDVPLVLCDARRGDTVIQVLITLVEHALSRAHAGT